MNLTPTNTVRSDLTRIVLAVILMLVLVAGSF